jgi:DNA-3-methyladenine glycosylase II
MAVISIPKPDEFSFAECLWFLNRNYDDCLNIVEDNQVTRAITLDGKVVVLKVTANEGNLLIDTGEDALKDTEKDMVQRYVREWFDMNRDIAPFYRLLSSHPVLGYMAGDFRGLRVMNIPNVFEALVWSIIGQQINLTFAHKLKRAMVEKYGTPIRCGNNVMHAFPQPEVLAALSIEELRGMQFSRQKAAYVINAAVAFRDGILSKESLWNLTTEEKVMALTALKGVGRWTANYVVMKSLNDTTGVPHGDVGLLKALEDHKLITDRKDDPAIAAVFGSFAGWESYLVHYLWRSLAIPAIPLVS